MGATYTHADVQNSVTFSILAEQPLNRHLRSSVFQGPQHSQVTLYHLKSDSLAQVCARSIGPGWGVEGQGRRVGFFVHLFVFM